MKIIKNIILGLLILFLLALIAAGSYFLYREKNKTTDELLELEKQKSQAAWEENLEYAIKEGPKYDYVVVLNPAHGGSDTGNNNAFGSEKDITLAICKKVMEINTDSSIGIFLTRTTDVALTETMRLDFINRMEPDLFLDVHLDKTSARDAGTFVCYDTSYYNRKLSNLTFADRMEKNVVSSIEGYAVGITDLTGLEESGLLKNLTMPAVRIVCGNMSGKTEGELLSRDNYRERLAAGILNGIMEVRGLPEAE